MESSPAMPARFESYRESLTATIRRTFTIALVLGTIGTIVRPGGEQPLAARTYEWLTLVTFVLWISFGGHWVELWYLNWLRMRLISFSGFALVGVRLLVWLIGGIALFLGAVTTRALMLRGGLPTESEAVVAITYGGPMFVAIETVPHFIAYASGRPSFWNGKG